MYAITRYGLVAKVPLLLDPTTQRILVHDDDQVLDFEIWLQTLPPATCSVTGGKGHSLLHGWWMSKGKPFRFTDLPAELSLSILELSYGFDIYPDHRNWLHGRGNKNDGNPWPELDFRVVPAPNLSVLTLDKATAKHMRKYSWELTCKCFSHSYELDSYVQELPRMPLQLAHLTILELNFETTDYIYFFGVKVAPFPVASQQGRGGAWCGAAVLRSLPSLAHLYIRFQPPRSNPSLYPSERHVRDPWCWVSEYRPVYGFGPPRSDRCSRWAHAEGTCQRLLTDWILTYAKEYIETIPKVTLCGFIKKDIRDKWQSILWDEREGISHDMTAAKRVIETWEMQDL